MSSVVFEHADGLPTPQRNWAIVTIALGIVMAVMDSAIANVALPTIARDLDASPAFSIWIVNGYQLAITISLLPLASLGEIIGYRRVYLAGLVLFTLASLFCALSHTLPLLTVARIVQGFGAAGIMSVNAALVRFTYPRAQLGRGIGINALVVAVSAAVGPTVAAAILAVGTWPYLFAINIPIGIAALALGWRCLPHTTPASHAFDWQSAGLSAVAFGVGIAAIDSVGHGEMLAVCLSEFAVAALAGVLLVFRQTHAASPLLPVDLLRIPIFALSIGTSIASFCGQMLAFVAIPFYLESRFGYSAVQMGLLITPWPIAVMFAAPLAGTIGRTLPGRPARRHRADLVRGRPRHAGDVAGRALRFRRGLADGAERRRFWPIPDPQQPHHDRRRAARAQRRRQRHARDRAAVGTNHGGGAGSAVSGALSRRRHPDFTIGRRRLRAARCGAQHAAAVARRHQRRRTGSGP
jgi:DHA2 family multidrug resistance protein-like MFS transporter